MPWLPMQLLPLPSSCCRALLPVLPLLLLLPLLPLVRTGIHQHQAL